MRSILIKVLALGISLMFITVLWTSITTASTNQGKPFEEIREQINNCPKCSEKMKVSSFIEDVQVIENLIRTRFSWGEV